MSIKRSWKECYQIINHKDLKVMFKIIEADLTVAGQARQKMSTAIKLFSQTTAKAIR